MGAEFPFLIFSAAVAVQVPCFIVLKPNSTGSIKLFTADVLFNFNMVSNECAIDRLKDPDAILLNHFT
jgi:hypothetical protein